MTAQIPLISHKRARLAAQRLINSHFQQEPRARMSIPARPEEDDDLVLCEYIEQQTELDGTDARRLDLFAAAALTGLISSMRSETIGGRDQEMLLSEIACNFAAAMLAKRSNANYPDRAKSNNVSPDPKSR